MTQMTTLAGPRLTPRELTECAHAYAGGVTAGRYPFVAFDADRRWHRRIHRDDRCDVWLISWLPTQGTQLHDHGESGGAFTVVSGRLAEAVLTQETGRAQLVEHERTVGTAVSFGANYVHDVRNLGDAPAVSVHVYSPPLTQMNFYDLDPAGRLSLTSTSMTDDPEAAPAA